MVLSNRRQLITGLISFVAAPAIVRASSLMPVKAVKLTEYIGNRIDVDVIYGTLKLGDRITFRDLERVWRVVG